MDNQPDFLHLAQHASALSIPVASVRNAIYRGTWPARTVTLGGRRLVPIAEHQRLVDALNSAGHIPLNGPAELERSEAAPNAPNAAPQKRRGAKRRGITSCGLDVRL